ncbi:DMBT1 protein, partial [Pycnonotus jocosus]|nr:DMBT1 protein [Pycnonotus jocosus]
RCEGRVELLHLGRWAGLCGHTWGLPEAQVVCRYLGCGTPLDATPTKAPGGAPGGTPGGTPEGTPGGTPEGTPGGAPEGAPGQVWLEQVSCKGTESDLRQCRAGPWREHTCAQGGVASVVCSAPCVLTCPTSPVPSPVPSPVSPVPAGSGLADLTHLRLAEGPHRCAGRVQVLHEGRWGGVCALTWAPPAADVTCRYLGCG